jgi:hypothetical protein
MQGCARRSVRRSSYSFEVPNPDINLLTPDENRGFIKCEIFFLYELFAGSPLRSGKFHIESRIHFANCCFLIHALAGQARSDMLYICVKPKLHYFSVVGTFILMLRSSCRFICMRFLNF